MSSLLNLQIDESEQDWIIQSIQSSLDGIWAWTTKSQNLIISPELHNILGYGDLNNKDYDWWMSIVHQDDLDNAQVFIQNILSGNTELNNFHCKVKKASGDYIKISISGRAHKDNDGSVNRAAGSVAIVADSSQSTDTVTDDLLGLLDNLTEKLQSANLPPEELESIAKLSATLRIEQQAQQSNEANNNFSIEDLINGSIELQKPILESKGLQINTMISQKLPDKVTGAFDEICQVMQVIVKDACDKTEEGYLNIIARPKVDNIIRFEVSDTRFPDETTAPENMESCKERIEKLGGSFDSTIMPGSGHVVWFELNLPKAGQAINDFQPKEADTAAEPDANSQSAVKLNILLAEDNLVNQEVMKGLVTKFGDNMDIAQNGQEALEMFKEGQYDLILMDINMPVMNGLEASKQIRALDADIPIVAVTANTMLEDRNNCLEHGMNSVETKPINSEKLKRVLDTYRINTDDEDALPVHDAGSITSESEVVETITENISIEPTEPAIDQGFLDGLTKDLGIETIKNLLSMYTRDAPPLVEQIKTEVVEAHTHSHTLAGMSENLGIVGVGKISREIMNVQSDSELQPLATKLSNKLDQAIVEISEFTAKH